MTNALNGSDPVLSVQDLRKTYATSRKASADDAPMAVDGVSFDVAPGETLALVGQSGSGKSTVARCVLRLLPVTSGRIVFDGRDITTLDGKERRKLSLRMQVVFQDPKQSFNPRLRLRTSLTEPLRVHGLPQEPAVGEVLEMVGLSTAYLRRYPHELSGGELQRLAIARALVLGPQLIVLDEPVSALDVSVQAQITSLLRELQAKSGVSYLFIAHDLAVVKELAHRVAVMRHGRILELRPSGELFSKPQDPYTKALIDASVIVEPGAPAQTQTSEVTA